MRSDRRAFIYLTAGHVTAMFIILVPFAVLAILLSWQHEIQVGESVLVIGFGGFLLIWRRHPRESSRGFRRRASRYGLSRLPPRMARDRLMLLPIYLGLCGSSDMDRSHQATQALIGNNLGMAFLSWSPAFMPPP